MTTHYKTQALVFKKTDANEADRNFSVFTSDFGRLDIFAKAIRKNTSKLRGGIDIFFRSEIEFIQGKNRKTLTDAAAAGKFNGILGDPLRFRIANRISEVLDSFIKGEEKDPVLFGLISEILVRLDDLRLPASKLQLLYYYFLWNFLSQQGYGPQVDKCNICHGKLNPYNIYFSAKSGGIICKKCLGHDRLFSKINSDIIKVLRLIFKKDWQVVSRLRVPPTSQRLLGRVSENYYSYILSSHSFRNI